MMAFCVVSIFQLSHMNQKSINQNFGAICSKEKNLCPINGFTKCSVICLAGREILCQTLRP